MENLRQLPDNPEFVLDVGIGHSGIFDFGEWEKRNLKRGRVLIYNGKI